MLSVSTNVMFALSSSVFNEPTSKYRITESPFPHRKTKFVSGSYNGNITPLDVSNSTITIGSSKASGARNEYCRSDDLLKL